MAVAPKPAPPSAGAKPPTEEAKAEAPPTSSSSTSSAELEKLRSELGELKEGRKRLNFSIRKLAAAILTPTSAADKGQSRRNAIAQAVQELVKEFGFEEEE